MKHWDPRPPIHVVSPKAENYTATIRFSGHGLPTALRRGEIVDALSTCSSACTRFARTSADRQGGGQG